MRTKMPLQADRMLDAASRLFAARHFHEVRMEDIAAEAGVGKGTLYRYFHTKDDLYLKLLDLEQAYPGGPGGWEFRKNSKSFGVFRGFKRCVDSSTPGPTRDFE